MFKARKGFFFPSLPCLTPSFGGNPLEFLDETLPAYIRGWRLERTEMRMLRWILGLTLREMNHFFFCPSPNSRTFKDFSRTLYTLNDDIRRILGVECITDKVREARLRWYGHVQRREEDDCVKRILEANVGGQRSRGRQTDGRPGMGNRI